ncbi:MAG: hypothetical protein ACOH2N_06075 [Devosia sp.]
MIRAVLIVIVALALSACSAFQIGERYDKSIDDDLNRFQTETVSFITSMRINAGAPAGAYTSEAAKAFYPKATATLSNIKLRAGQLSSRQCPVNAIANKITLPLDGVLGEIVETDQPPTVVTGNCAEVTLLSIEKQLVDLEKGHRERKQIGPIRAQWHIDGINKSVAIALSGLRAKDY